ncbi:hypothetical protein AN478_03835 [Thiohalorhabdus denitrificans]|uniref:Heptosyltransferase-1 n=1 Tax=Thiohalorhabdus denitrificans TaxID=381306 RepID=A0A0P9GLK0_9GAMM|nr:glycosyltransferase family 9 protein [Thiohalorhabdus denitrificans]KPV41064.1 hypothetical protein AN478_03835 [Thiohalorhabdus denitrificans]SCY39959.1 heptosyltransferase-1 [Thiohalorhabdus denitrificans]
MRRPHRPALNAVARSPEDTAPRAILVIRLSAIGDVVMASAVLPVLRRAYPDARIDWLAEPPADAVLAAREELGEVIRWPKAEWRGLLRRGRLWALLRAFLGLARGLRRNRYDLVLDLQGLAKSGLWARLTGAPERVGLGSREGSRWLMTRVVARDGNEERIASEYRNLVRELGLEPGAFPLAPAVSGTAREEAARALAEAGIKGPFAVLAPFTTRPQKHWLEERWADLAARIRDGMGLPVVLVGGPGDRAAAARIAARTEGEVADLAGRTGLAGSLAVLREAALCVGVDTGLTHAAIGFGTPTVALFGSTRPYLDPATPSARVLYSGLPCAPCGRRPTCGGAFHCMAAIPVDDVLAEARAVRASTGDTA